MEAPHLGLAKSIYILHETFSLKLLLKSFSKIHVEFTIYKYVDLHKQLINPNAKRLFIHLTRYLLIYF